MRSLEQPAGHPADREGDGEEGGHAEGDDPREVAGQGEGFTVRKADFRREGGIDEQLEAGSVHDELLKTLYTEPRRGSRVWLRAAWLIPGFQSFPQRHNAKCMPVLFTGSAEVCKGLTIKELCVQVAGLPEVGAEWGHCLRDQQWGVGAGDQCLSFRRYGVEFRGYDAAA